MLFIACIINKSSLTESLIAFLVIWIFLLWNSSKNYLFLKNSKIFSSSFPSGFFRLLYFLENSFSVFSFSLYCSLFFALWTCYFETSYLFYNTARKETEKPARITGDMGHRNIPYRPRMGREWQQTHRGVHYRVGSRVWWVPLRRRGTHQTRRTGGVIPFGSETASPERERHTANSVTATLPSFHPERPAWSALW